MIKSSGKSIALIGATGLVGRTFIEVMEERKFSAGNFIPAATDASVGREIKAFGGLHTVRSMDEVDFSGADYAFFTAGRTVSCNYIPHALECGCRVIDNTTAFRMSRDVPLIVPEINGRLVTGEIMLAASPNCTTIILSIALAALQRLASIERVVLTSFQSVSGAGREALEELDNQTKAYNENRPMENKVYGKTIAFNCIPEIGDFEPGAYSGEEEKIITESRKILGSPNLNVIPTAVRVPVHVGHAISVFVEFEREISMIECIKVFKDFPGIDYDDGVPTQLDAAGRDGILVGRLRRDRERKNAFSLWVVGDNLRKGAATNSVQIAELMLAREKESQKAE